MHRPAEGTPGNGTPQTTNGGGRNGTPPPRAPSGFDPAEAPEGHLGVAGLLARAIRLAADRWIVTRPRGGTRIEVTMPILSDRSGQVLVTVV